jgi:ADYC domain
MSDPDLGLLARWRDGDSAAGQELFKRHFESLYRFFRNKCAGHCDELVQSTLLACLEAKQQFRGDSRFRTYLFAIRITGVHRKDGLPFWVGDKRMIETYDFHYTPISDSTPPDSKFPSPALCSEGDNDPSKITAIVFGGDLYDPVTKKITVGSMTDGWFNIACADSAIYKMHRIGYTSAAQRWLQNPPFNITTSITQRRAMLNAWTANVCGDGTSFTEQGEQITLREKVVGFNISPYNDTPMSYEAIWNEHGAFCLNVPRRYEDVPDLCTKVQNTCVPPPPCDAALINEWESHGDVLTGNRPDS